MERDACSDRLAIRDVALRYARAVDRRDYALAATLFAEDAELLGPGFHVVGRDSVVRGLRRVEHYDATFHAVHNQLVELSGDTAEGETYCIAAHLFARDGRRRKLDWGIRYQDRYVRSAEGWQLARRELVVDWTQEHDLGPA